MGNKNTNSQNLPNYSNYTSIQKFNMDSLGEFDLCKDFETNLTYLLITTNYSIINSEMVESEIFSLKRLNEIKNVSELIQYSIEKEKNLCFDNYSLKLLFKEYSLTIEKIALGPSDPKENDIWIIIGDIIEYLSDMKLYEVYNGDIQPKYIQISDAKIVKIISPLLYTVYQNAYKYRLANESYKSCFSPELLEQFQNRVQNPNYDFIKNDIFSVGICILSLMTRESFTYFYDFKENVVLFDKVRMKLAESVKSRGFSERLFYFVDLCLKKNLYERAGLDMLRKLVGNNKNMTSTQFWKNNY